MIKSRRSEQKSWKVFIGQSRRAGVPCEACQLFGTLCLPHAAVGAGVEEAAACAIVQVRCCSSLVSGQHCIVLHCNAAAVPRPAVTDDPDGVSCGHCSLLHPHNAHTLLSGERSAVRRLQECIAQTAEKNVGEVEECNSTVQLIGKCTS